MAASLVGGLMVTVAIAWTAMLVPYGSHGYGPAHGEFVGRITSPTEYKTWELSRGGNGWHDVVSYWWMQVSGLSLTMTGSDADAHAIELDSLPSHLRPHEVEHIDMWASYHEVGWPVRALTCSIHWERQIRNADVLYRVEGGLQLPRDREFHPRALPLTPIWPGFAVSVLMWGAASWLGICSVMATRRACRRRRQRCVHCGYSLRGLARDARCPECGG